MYNEFENALVRGIHISRYIASWTNLGGSTRRIYHANGECGAFEFRDWLATLIIDGEHLTETEIDRIVFYSENGKLELETLARRFINDQKMSYSAKE